MGPIEGLEYPIVFRRNIFALAGHWKINEELIKQCKLAWFDPFMGHGKTPLYAKKMGINYLGFDNNKKAFEIYLDDLNKKIQSIDGSNVEIRCQDSTEFIPDCVHKFDLCYTSPPYFKNEEYGGNTSFFDGCDTYEEFHEKITIPVFKNVYQYLIKGGLCAVQVEKNEKNKALWSKTISSIGFELVNETLTGREKEKYSVFSKRDQNLLIFRKPYDF